VHDKQTDLFMVQLTSLAPERLVTSVSRHPSVSKGYGFPDGFQDPHSFFVSVFDIVERSRVRFSTRLSGRLLSRKSISEAFVNTFILHSPDDNATTGLCAERKSFWNTRYSTGPCLSRVSRTQSNLPESAPADKSSQFLTKWYTHGQAGRCGLGFIMRGI